MKRRFIILVDDATSDEQNRLTDFLRKRPMVFWHYFSDSWLVVDTDAQWSTATLRDQLVKLLPGKMVMVLHVDNGTTWAAFGAVKNFDWIQSDWEPN